jgi:hypothetical protein
MNKKYDDSPYLSDTIRTIYYSLQLRYWKTLFILQNVIDAAIVASKYTAVLVLV